MSASERASKFWRMTKNLFPNSETCKGGLLAGQSSSRREMQEVGRDRTSRLFSWSSQTVSFPFIGHGRPPCIHPRFFIQFSIGLMPGASYPDHPLQQRLLIPQMNSPRLTSVDSYSDAGFGLRKRPMHAGHHESSYPVKFR